MKIYDRKSESPEDLKKVKALRLINFETSIHQLKSATSVLLSTV